MKTNVEVQVSHSKEERIKSGGRGGSISASVAFTSLCLLKKAKGVSQPWNPGEPPFSF